MEFRIGHEYSNGNYSFYVKDIINNRPIAVWDDGLVTFWSEDIPQKVEDQGSNCLWKSNKIKRNRLKSPAL